MRVRPSLLVSLVLSPALAAPATAQQEDATPWTPSFEEGDVITVDEIESLKPFLPAEFWSNRDFFFYEGMQLEIGPFFRDYSPPPEYQEAKASRSPGAGGWKSPASRRSAFTTCRISSPASLWPRDALRACS